MRKLLIALIAVCLFILVNSSKASTNFLRADTTHEVDGNIKEWNDSSFTKDAATNISYAVANTNTHLYVALKCDGIFIQAKFMQLGMQMYINEKGKHRQSTGIGFPIRDENMQSLKPGETPDMRPLKQKFVLNLLSMNLFGFDGTDDKKQGLSIEGSVNIAYSWDDANTMYIEYSIPLTYINSNVASLNGKSIAIGWKVNGVESITSNTSSLVVVSNNGGRGGSRGGSRSPLPPSYSNNTNTSANSMMKEQIIWSKYDIKF
ncbi:MAG: hypothetical protein JST94_02150 [Bacteroidetes bacterium]|nr:hypothetical protein [Bacteroidota bacterium]MBS1642563.1 hypothetical protein [Bacteroidota bacterium]MBS1670248.1 hypothetical protein [Bacteroidota bacterium]